MNTETMDARIEELRKLREWLSSYDDVESAEEIAELLNSLEYPSQARKLVEIAKGEVHGDETSAQRLKEMQRIVDGVIRKAETAKASAPSPRTTATRSAAGRGRTSQGATFRLELLGYFLFFLLGFLAGRYFG